MSAVVEQELAPQATSRPRADTLAASVVILLAMTAVQRLIGFGRGIMFCRWLEPEQLGQWDVAFGFLNLAAPLAVLGLPGSFGRYVEYFRQRSQFHIFLRRTAAAGALTSLIVVAVMMVERRWFSRLIFGSDDNTGLVMCVAACLIVVIMHNYLTAMFIAVRRYRYVSALQFLQSLAFALVGLTLLAAWPSATSVVIGYSVATMLSAVGSIAWLRELTSQEPAASQGISHTAFWAKLVPFAVWMWITNLLANLFEVIDRYMIVHHSGLEANEALRQVGYYHSSRLVPLLFVAVAGLLGSMITPHLSHDWEAGRRVAVVSRLNMVLKLLLVSLFGASVAVLFFAPLLFEVAFQNKFHGGLVVLPWTLTYCAWFGTIAVAQNYLWCAERPGLSSFALLAGLLLNIGLNLLLLPSFGLEGAVWATTVANFTALVLIYIFSTWQGMHVDIGTWTLSLAPATLWLGPWAALGVLAAIATLTLCGHRILTLEEKQHVADAISGGVQRLRRIGAIPRAKADCP